jgi:putative ABC transport system ATP-binding protein
MTIIQLSQVSKKYGSAKNPILAIDDVSLDVEAGEFVIITGHSGGGKTSLLNLISGMTVPTSGNILIDDVDINRLSDAERTRIRGKKIGFVFQFPSLLPTLNAFDNVRLPLRFAGKQDDGDLARALLEQVGLGSRTSAMASELSEGQKRRVSIARALITRPALLLCDEPTGDLDDETEGLIMDMLDEARAQGATILMTTHNTRLRRRGTSNIKIVNGRVFDE